tara:strand:+ start:5181 stop:6899 length:1719 start_codon:yes stop_codon:yes gene_type:complete
MTSNYLRIFTFIKPRYKDLFLTFFIILAFATANVYFLPLIRDIANEISNKRTIYISMQILNAFILWFIRTIALYGQTYMTNKIGNLIVIDIQETIYQKLHTFSQHFYSNWKIGELLVRLFDDAAKVNHAITTTFSQIIPQLLTLVGVIIYLFFMCWQLTLFAFVAVPLFVVTISYFSNLIKRLSSPAQKNKSNITHLVQESLTNMKLVQAYTMESASNSRLKRENKKNFSFAMKSIRLRETKRSIELLLQGFVLISLLFYGGHLVANNVLTSPELLSFFTGCGLLIDPIIAFSSGFTSIKEADVSINRIYQILDYEPKIKNSTNGLTPQIIGHVVIKNASFHYDEPKTLVLNNISIEASQGETIALVGLSGAGKTTLINLIPRFYDVISGYIQIDGYNVKDLDLYHLRNHIGLVLQDDILFSGSILENIRYGSPNANENDIIEAAKASHCWDFIETMPDKLYTLVGDQGQRLSGGQKQRISIARAILRDPKILILDEATSALDSESEHLIKNALIKLMTGRTTFVIAHRLSTIKHANKILVLDKGAIIEEGTHDELLALNGQYSKLYNLQFR